MISDGRSNSSEEYNLLSSLFFYFFEVSIDEISPCFLYFDIFTTAVLVVTTLCNVLIETSVVSRNVTRRAHFPTR